MSEGITLKRIIDMDEATELTSSDYALVDSSTGGPKKFALGGELSSLKEDLTQVNSKQNKYFGITVNNSTVEQGSINSSGTEISRANRVRTGYISIDATAAKIVPSINTDAYKFSYAFYSGTSEENYMDDSHDPNEIDVANNTDIAIPQGAKYVRIIIAKLKEGYIYPSDMSGYTISILYPSYIGYLYDDVQSLIYPNEGVVYKKGLPAANGSINDSLNGVYSSIIRLVNTLYISDDATAVILLYRGNSYVGKVNSSGGVDTVGGNWKYFSGLVDVAKLLNDNQCDGVLIGLIPNDGTTISDDTTASAFASAHLEYSTTTCIQTYVSKQETDFNKLDIPQTFAFNLCAHRGSSAVKNNTIAAFERAITIGYRVIETDINWTSDNVCILYHDSDIDGTAINTLTYTQIHAIDADIPTFTEMLLWAKKHKCLMFLDCVGRLTDQSAETLYNTTAQYGMLDNVVFSVGADLAYDMADNLLIKTNISVNFYGRNPTVAMIQAIDPKVNQFKSVMTGYDKDDITSEIILASHLKGYPVEIATITTQQSAKSYYDMGVDMLVCDADELWNV